MRQQAQTAVLLFDLFDRRVQVFHPFPTEKIKVWLNGIGDFYKTTDLLVVALRCRFSFTLQSLNLAFQNDG